MLAVDTVLSASDLASPMTRSACCRASATSWLICSSARRRAAVISSSAFERSWSASSAARRRICESLPLTSSWAGLAPALARASASSRWAWRAAERACSSSA